MLLPTKEFYNKHASYYDKGIDTFESINENKVRSELVKKFIPNHSKVLDLGCGSGFGYAILKDIVDKYIGIDISIGLLKIACTKFKNDVRSEKVTFKYGDLEKKSIVQMNILME